MNWTAVIWLLLMVIFLMAEASTVSVVSIWFAVGSLGAMIASLCGAQLWLQVVIFLVLSAGLLACLRPITKKYFTPKLVKTNVDAVIGTTGIVLEPIDNTHSTGRVKLGSMEWSARSTNGEMIEKDTLIRADRVEGVKVFVSPAQVSTPVN